MKRLLFVCLCLGLPLLASAQAIDTDHTINDARSAYRWSLVPDRAPALQACIEFLVGIGVAVFGMALGRHPVGWVLFLGGLVLMMHATTIGASIILAIP